MIHESCGTCGQIHSPIRSCGPVRKLTAIDLNVVPGHSTQTLTDAGAQVATYGASCSCGWQGTRWITIRGEDTENAQAQAKQDALDHLTSLH